MAIIDFSGLSGTPQKQKHIDAETGCFYFGGAKDSTYEACRQSYYAKQQNEILRQGSQQEEIATLANKDQKIKELESYNTNLQKIADQQNKQITQLIQSSEQAAQKNENLNVINVVLIAVLLVTICSLLSVKFIRRSRLKNNKLEIEQRNNTQSL